MIEDELANWLFANIALAVGGVWNTKLPQDPTFPAITVRKISGPRLQSHDGPSGTAYPRIEIGCWSDDYGDAHELATEVRQDLDGFTGAMGAIFVQAAILKGERDIHYPDTDFYQVPVEFIIWHTET